MYILFEIASLYITLASSMRSTCKCVTYPLVLGIQGLCVHARPAAVLDDIEMYRVSLWLIEIVHYPHSVAGQGLRTFGVIRHVSFSAAGEAKNFFDYIDVKVSWLDSAYVSQC